MRLQKYLSRSGAASRREAERLMAAGRVRVNGMVVTALGTRVRPGIDRVELDGRAVEPAPARWIALNKPAGYVTTRRDPGGRRTVYDLLPEELRGLRYVGRLDRGTTGLILFTNDGEVMNRLLHPSGEVEREYRAWVEGRPDERTLARLRSGVELEDGPARAARAEVVEVSGPRTLLALVLLEGRKREVRRLCEAVGHPVAELERVRFGPLALGGLAPGRWRELTEGEIRSLRDWTPPSPGDHQRETVPRQGPEE